MVMADFFMGKIGREGNRFIGTRKSGKKKAQLIELDFNMYRYLKLFVN